MKKVLLGTLALSFLSATVMVVSSVAAPIAAGPWTDYEYYQKDSPAGSPGQYVQEGQTYDFYFDLAFFNAGSTNSDLTQEEDVAGYGPQPGNVPVGDVWASFTLFSVDAEWEQWLFDVTAYSTGKTYELGPGVVATGPNTDTYTQIYKFSGDLLDDWKLDPWGNIKLSITAWLPDFEESDLPGYNDFNLVEVGMGVTAVPEPATMLLFGAGLAGLAGVRRRMKK